MKPSVLIILLSFLVFPGALPGAQDSDLPEEPGEAFSPPTELSSTLSASYGFIAQGGPMDEGDPWSSSQWVNLGFFGRWGSGLTLQGELNADFTSRPLEADALLPQVFLTWNAGDSLVVTLGKQRLQWGTARVFPSLDRLEPMGDPTSSRKTVAGVTGIRLEYLPTHWLSVQVLGLPAEKLPDSRGALRLDFLAWDVDLALGILNYRGRYWEANGSGTPNLREETQAAGYGEVSWFGDRFGFYMDAQVRTGRDRAFYLVDPGNPDEILFSRDPGGVWLNLTAGIQSEIPLWNRESATFLGEYHFQGDGWDGAETLALRPLLTREMMGNLTSIPSVGSLRRHYLFTGLSGIPLGGPATGSLSLSAGPESGFWLASAVLDWRLDSVMTLSAGYRQAGQWLEETANPGDLLLLPWRHQVTLGISGSF